MNILKRAIEKYGASHQVQKCREELTELLDAINKYEDGRDTLNHVAEEIADVQITIDQLKMIYNIELEVELWKTKKLDRLTERLAQLDGKQMG